MPFFVTTHLSEIIEASHATPVIIFKHSETCWSSRKLRDELAQRLENGSIKAPTYIVTVQEKPELSRKIREWFDVKHETPQILIIDGGKVIYEVHHDGIDLNKLNFG